MSSWCSGGAKDPSGGGIDPLEPDPYAPPVNLEDLLLNAEGDGENGQDGHDDSGNVPAQRSNLVEDPHANNVPIPPPALNSTWRSNETTSSSRLSRFQRQHDSIVNRFAQIRQNATTLRPETMKEKLQSLREDFKRLKVSEAVTECNKHPNPLDVIGCDGDGLADWAINFKVMLDEELTVLSENIFDKRSYHQYGFEKLKHPSFKGDVLEFYDFYKTWQTQVSPEDRAESIEHAALLDNVPLVPLS